MAVKLLPSHPNQPPPLPPLIAGVQQILTPPMESAPMADAPHVQIQASPLRGLWMLVLAPALLAVTAALWRALFVPRILGHLLALLPKVLANARLTFTEMALLDMPIAARLALMVPLMLRQ